MQNFIPLKNMSAVIFSNFIETELNYCFSQDFLIMESTW